MFQLQSRVSRDAWFTHPNVHAAGADRVSVRLRIRQIPGEGRGGGRGRGRVPGGGGLRRPGFPGRLRLVEADDVLALVEAYDLGVPAPAEQGPEQRLLLLMGERRLELAGELLAGEALVLLDLDQPDEELEDLQLHKLLADNALLVDGR